MKPYEFLVLLAWIVLNSLAIPAAGEAQEQHVFIEEWGDVDGVLTSRLAGRLRDLGDVRLVYSEEAADWVITVSTQEVNLIGQDRSAGLVAHLRADEVVTLNDATVRVSSPDGGISLRRALLEIAYWPEIRGTVVGRDPGLAYLGPYQSGEPDALVRLFVANFDRECLGRSRLWTAWERALVNNEEIERLAIESRLARLEGC